MSTKHDKDRRPGADDDAGYAAVRKDRMPPEALEDRIVDQLNDRGLILQRRLGFRFIAIRTGIAAALLAFGFWSGMRYLQFGQTQSGQRFILLLYETAPGEAGAGRVEEYRRWAHEQRDKGYLLQGEKLRDDAHMVLREAEEVHVQNRSATRGQAILSGYFIIRASSYAEAAKVAETCPHLLYGGRVEIREIERT